ncbi:MAG: TetR family transcriptional regulator [Kineosporiaceae bacterium]
MDGAATRDQILATALRLFREHGYEATTMRRIATEAGVATGNAYYYFPSKQHLVQELYREVTAEHARRAREVLAAAGPDLGARLAAVWAAGLDVFEPYHAFGVEFVTTAIRPGSPSSPFSPASAAARETSLAMIGELVTGIRPRVPERLREQLPELLWLAQLGIMLFWVHDDSPGQRRTRALTAQAAPLVARLVRLARLPVLRTAVDDVLRLVTAGRS